MKRKKTSRTTARKPPSKPARKNPTDLRTLEDELLKSVSGGEAHCSYESGHCRPAMCGCAQTSGGPY